MMVQQKYKFTLNPLTTGVSRSAQLDAGYVSATVAVAGQTPMTKTRAMGGRSDGIRGTSLIFDDVTVGDDQAVAFCYLVISSHYADPGTVERELGKAASALGSSAAHAHAQAVGAGSGAAVGASIGTAAVPLIGSALGALTGWIVAQVDAVVAANGDGPVAAGVHPFVGSDLHAQTQHGPCRIIDCNPHSPSPLGCEHNPGCDVSWTVESLPSTCLSLPLWHSVWIKAPQQRSVAWGCARQIFDERGAWPTGQLDLCQLDGLEP